MKYMLGDIELRLEDAGLMAHGKKVLYVFTDVPSSKQNQELAKSKLQELVVMGQENKAYWLLITCDEGTHFDAEINVETGELELSDFDDPRYDWL